MGDLASDHDAAIELIVNEYHRLEKHDRHHELLQYITNVTDQSFKYVPDKYQAFFQRFETPEDKKNEHITVVKVLTSYFISLRNAVDHIEGIDRSPAQPIAPADKAQPKAIYYYDDVPADEIDEIPF